MPALGNHLRVLERTLMGHSFFHQSVVAPCWMYAEACPLMTSSLLIDHDVIITFRCSKLRKRVLLDGRSRAMQRRRPFAT